MNAPAARSASLAGGLYRATVSAVGATLTTLRCSDRALIHGVDPVDVSQGYHSAVLAPWPNRIDRGAYQFAGTRYQLPINDEAYGHAIHGFVADAVWAWESRTDDTVTLSTRIDPDPGYPHSLGLQVTYTVDGTGLSCRTVATNLGDAPAPFGLGFHPYLTAGPHPLDEWVLHVPASHLLDVDPATLIPTDLVPTAGSGVDFRTPAAISTRAFSHAYTGWETQGWHSVRVRDPSGSGVVLDMCPTFRWVQIFTADLPTPRHRRAGLGVEPMTCPPNALATGRDLSVLAPGGTTTATWRLRAEPS